MFKKEFENLTSKKIFIILIFGFLTVNMLGIGLTSFLLSSSKESSLKDVANSNKNFSDILSNNISKIFEKTELLFESFDNYVNSNDISLADEFLSSQATYYKDLDNLTILDINGNVQFSINSSITNSFNKDSFFINSLKDDKLVIFNYVINNKNVLLFSKKIIKKNKTIGVVFATFNIDNFNYLFNSINIGQLGSIIISDNQMKPILIYNSTNNNLLTNYLKSSFYLNAKKYLNNNDKLFFYDLSFNDNDYLFSSRKITYFDFYISIGLNKSDYLIQWNKQIYQFIIFYLFFAIISFIFSLAIFSVWKKETIKEKKLSSILNSANEGIYGVDEDGLCTFCNPKACELLGYSQDELLGKDINNLIFKSTTDIPNSSTIEIELITKLKKSFFVEIVKYHQFYDTNLSSFIYTFTDISLKKNFNNVLAEQANTDSLTKVSNRSYFEKYLKKLIINKNKFALLFIDLDDFKNVNDTFGHHSGDDLLIQVVHRLKTILGNNVMLARLGGDEFTVVVEDFTHKQEIAKICNDIITYLKEPFNIKNHICYIGCSIGVTFYPEDSTNFEKLLQNADQSMYLSKDVGKNTFNFFSLELDNIIKQKIEISNDLSTAISNNELELFIQPIFSNKLNKIVKGEILLRWNHPKKGYISPADFIPISEKNGLIHTIGEWVFVQSCYWLKNFLKNNPNFQISINVSPLQLRNVNFINNIKKHLTLLNLPKNSIIIEITEGILLDSDSDIFTLFNDLKSLGIKIAIDDFGTGYSAMSYLYKYDIDFIKIDKSFILNLNKDKNQKITKSLISMGQNLGIEIIAEGVETQEQLKFLNNINCDYIQGYLFSKPIDIKIFKL